ncbi:MAG: efflux RND transporter periplasmic adaptor subunit [Ginsengibacter sp.]
MWSCNNKTIASEERSRYKIPDQVLKTLKIDTVQQCSVINQITLTGKVGFNDEKISKIFPMISGIISGINVQLGDYVYKGQILGTIRSSEMAGFGNDLINSKTNLLIAKKNMDAAEDMYKSGLMSQKDFITAQAMYRQATSQLNRSKQVLQINGGSTNGQYTIKAPSSGFIVEKLINNNMAIRSDNTNSLFTISDLKDVWVLANVYESNINKIHMGDSVEVTTLSYPDKIFKGIVNKILNVLDPANKVLKLKIILANSAYLLKPEMFASINVFTKSNDQSLCVPTTALVFDNSQYFIIKYNNQADLKIIPVKVISNNNDRTYISGNINQGEKIISSNALLIYNSVNN